MGGYVVTVVTLGRRCVTVRYRSRASLTAKAD